MTLRRDRNIQKYLYFVPNNDRIVVTIVYLLVCIETLRDVWTDLSLALSVRTGRFRIEGTDG